MNSVHIELHPIYGAVPPNGALVQAGDVLGLSADSEEVLTAPMDGRIRLISVQNATQRRLYVQISQESLAPLSCASGTAA